jgi:hypothetical protein
MLHKKKAVKLLLLLTIFAMTLSLVSCSLLETERGNEIKVQCEDMVDAILANDRDAAYDLLVDVTDKAQFEAVFPSLCAYVSGVETYKLVQKGWYARVNNGVSSYEATFEMKTNKETYYVTGVEMEGHDGLYQFSITLASESEFVFTGTLTTLEGANLAQWGMIGFSVACLVFVLIMLIDCCKRKIKYKPLWIILILLGAVVFTVKTSHQQLDFNFSIALLLFSYSHLQIFATGASIFRLVLPIGAILYLIFRKKLTLAKTVKVESMELPPEPNTVESPENASEMRTDDKNE